MKKPHWFATDHRADGMTKKAQAVLGHDLARHGTKLIKIMPGHISKLEAGT